MSKRFPNTIRIYKNSNGAAMGVDVNNTATNKSARKWADSNAEVFEIPNEDVSVEFSHIAYRGFQGAKVFRVKVSALVNGCVKDCGIHDINAEIALELLKNRWSTATHKFVWAMSDKRLRLVPKGGKAFTEAVAASNTDQPPNLTAEECQMKWVIRPSGRRSFYVGRVKFFYPFSSTLSAPTHLTYDRYPSSLRQSRTDARPKFIAVHDSQAPAPKEVEWIHAFNVNGEARVYDYSVAVPVDMVDTVEISAYMADDSGRKYIEIKRK